MVDAHKTSRLALALLATTMLTQPGSTAAAPGDALGPEFQVSSFTTHNQVKPAVAMDADGDFVVAWMSVGPDGAGEGIRAQRYDSSGHALGGELAVNILTSGNQRFPAVAMDADGDFVVAWQGPGPYEDGYGIFARRFDASGTALDIVEFPVNTFTFGNQVLPVAAMDADGDFVVAWESHDQDGSGRGIYAQRYDAAGVAQGDEFPVNTLTTNNQMWPSVAMDASGRFIVAWSGNGPGDSSAVFARRYDAGGVPEGPEFRVNTTTTGSQEYAGVAMDADGDFVVAWESVAQYGVWQFHIFARRFDAAGGAQGPEFRVNTFTANDQVGPVVAMDADGDFVVAWTSYGQEDPAAVLEGGIFAQRYDPAGVAQGAEFQVNSFTTSFQLQPVVAMDADGDFVVAWESYQQDGSGFGVFAQRYDGVERVPGDFDGDGNEDLLWHNAATGAAHVWLMAGATKLAAQTIGRPPLTWQVAGIGEFNGDGKADILWRNTATGAVLVWQMDGLTIVDAVRIDSAPPVWVVEKVADSDGDGLSDIFWRNGATGATLVWRMRGFTHVATGATGGVIADWQVK